MNEIDHLDFASGLVDITAAVCAALDRIGEEMSGRLECDLTEKDHHAVESAVRKAIYAGREIAHAAIREYLLREKGIEIGSALPLDEIDVWAERYGDELDEDEAA